MWWFLWSVAVNSSSSGSRRRRCAALAIAIALSSCTANLQPANQSPGSPVERSADERPVAVDDEWFATGFLDFPIQWDENTGLGAGFSMYVAVWPFQETYPGPSYQTGLPSTWLVPANVEGIPGENYSTIEGGLGWWNDTRFATETPKFTMGGVSRNFSEWANGPGAGAGTADVDRRDWDVPQGKYGVAQLSPYILWAPDGLNLEEGTNGGLFGYGYHPLPIIDARERVGEQDTPTGNRSWTLFLNTGNFKGPVSFFMPDFFAKPSGGDPSLDGVFFDSSLMVPHRSVAMETQVIPAVHAIDIDGTSFAKITRVQFPANDEEASIILNRVASYSEAAVWTPALDWFTGAESRVAAFAMDAAHVSTFDAVESRDVSSYTIIYEGIDEAREYLIDWASLAQVDVSDSETFRYRWNLDVVERDGDTFVLPEYYRLDEGLPEPMWTPVAAGEVPVTTGLRQYEFPDLGRRNDGEAFTTPGDPSSVWMTPGPASGPFQTELGDGSLVTYHWYRFVDQPAIQHWGFSNEELRDMQSRVELIHGSWGPAQDYLAPPSVGELANLDPAIVVRPPRGFEVGYVPIVTRQESAGR